MRDMESDSMDLGNDVTRIIETALEAASLVHPDRATNLSALGSNLYGKYRETASKSHLDAAIKLSELAIEALPQTHPDQPLYADDLANRLGARFELVGSMDDLNRAIELANTAVEAVPPDDPTRGRFLLNLAIWTSRRFEQTGSKGDIDRAIDLGNAAVNSVPEDSPDRANRLSSLGNFLGRRHELTNSVDDLDRAISVAELAVKDTSQDRLHQAASLNTLGMWLGRRFDRTGSKADLDRAVEATDKAANVVPLGNPHRALPLVNLGMWLLGRFDLTGSMSDLDRAISVTEDALELISADSPWQPVCLNNHAMGLNGRFDRTGEMGDINRAVESAEQAVKVTPLDHPHRSVCLGTLSSCLARRYDGIASIDDLDRAIEVAEMALTASASDHAFLASHLNSLGVWLGRRYDKTRRSEDLNRAIEVAERALQLTPRDHLDRASCLNNLGCYLDKRSQLTGSTDDAACSLSAFLEGWKCPSAPPSIRIRLAMGATDTYVSQSNWEDASRLLEEAVGLLPAVSPRSSTRNDGEHMLANFVGLASAAAAVALNVGKDACDALKLLELGRGVISNLLMDMRGDISELRRSHSDLADQFESLRDELDAPAASQTASGGSSGESSASEYMAKRRREADEEFSGLIAKIRAKPGFGNFFLPPTTDEMMAAADDGPIVFVSLSRFRCDAFLVKRDRISVVELPDLTLKEVLERTYSPQEIRLVSSSDMEAMLEWLWDVICRPCLDALGYKDAPQDNIWPRVWWIPTRYLNRLPLHAAGKFGTGSADTVMDRVMSSYASSVKGLQQGRRHAMRSASGPGDDDSALLVAMPETPDLATRGLLPFARDEVDMLETLCPSLGLKPITPLPQKDEVLKRMPMCKIFHFAGHGRSNPANPSRSCLLLEDWKTNPLTAGILRDSRLQDNSPFLAYLSACETGANEAERFSDEGVHLVNAFQLAGFRHVVGTLWGVSDKHCVDVARILYKTMRDEGMTDTAVCRGLHRAVMALRDGRIALEVQDVNEGLESAASGAARTRDITDCDDDEVKLFHWVPYVLFGV